MPTETLLLDSLNCPAHVVWNTVGPLVPVRKCFSNIKHFFNRSSSSMFLSKYSIKRLQKFPPYLNS